VRLSLLWLWLLLLLLGMLCLAFCVWGQKAGLLWWI
jgi:hypothetical protein